MRPFPFFSTFLFFFVAAALVAADPTEIIGNQDQRISYSDNWKFFPFPTGQGGTLAIIKKPEGTASLRVENASRIAVTVFVQTPGQMVRISLDNENHDISPSLSQQPAWTSSKLDPSVPHTIQVIKQNPGGQFTSLDSFLVTTSDSASNGSTSSAVSADATGGANVTSTPASPGPQGPQATSALAAPEVNREPVLSGGRLAAVVAVCITVPAFIIVGILYRRRVLNKRKAASTAYWEYISNRAQAAQAQSSTPFPPPTPNEKFEGAEAREMA